MTEQHPHVTLARKFFDSIVERNFEALSEIFADDAVMWQNVRGVEVLFAANISAIEWPRWWTAQRAGCCGSRMAIRTCARCAKVGPLPGAVGSGLPRVERIGLRILA